MNSGSAIVSFNGLDVRCGIFQIYAKGVPETLRMALRKACSHRRRLVTTRPSVYFLNCNHELLSLVGSDNMDYLGPDRNDDTYDAVRPTVNWGYRIWMKDRAPTISYSDHNAEPVDIGLFTFLGMEHVRPYNWTSARKKRRGGRPTGLRKTNPEIFEPGFSGKSHRAAIKHQATTTDNTAVAQNGDTLGLKDKPRKVHVDFTGVIMPNPDYGETLLDLDQALEFDQLEGTEAGAQP